MPGAAIAPIDIDAAQTGAFDVFEITAAAGHPLELRQFRVGQRTEVGDAQEEVLTLALYRVSGSPTSGSGGGTSTFRGTGAQGASVSATIETGNTTPLSGGTQEELDRWDWKLRLGVEWIATPEFVYACAAGEKFVLKVLDAPGDSIGGTNGIVGSVGVWES